MASGPLILTASSWGTCIEVVLGVMDMEVVADEKDYKITSRRDCK